MSEKMQKNTNVMSEKRISPNVPFLGQNLYKKMNS